jgi:oxygen-independent coproporphyrinogen-3 oxidase
MLNPQSEIRNPKSAYIHVPFCAHRCGYCNFTLVAGRGDLVEPYLQAIEIELRRLESPRPVDTLFFGGGTPTQLSGAQFDRLLKLVLHWFPLADNGEFSVEANPADLDEAKTKLLADHGVTRISLGAQSFDDNKLQVLERDHRAAQVRAVYDMAKRHVDQVSLDLIFGVPGEKLDVWRADLVTAKQLGADHVSTYGLTFERGAAFWSRRAKGQLAPVAEDLERTMYLLAIDELTAAGFEHYEVSNFAQPDCRCRHNEVYWTGAGYYAAGPGAARFVGGVRETNHRSTTTYIKRVLAGRSPVAESESLEPEAAARERLVFGLRRLEGIDLEQFRGQTGFSVEALVGQTFNRHAAAGLLEVSGGWLRLTREGLLVSDSIWPDFL